jgi:PMR5 N terminal Domain
MKVRNKLNSLVALLFGLFIFLVASLGVRNGDWKAVTRIAARRTNSRQCDFFSGRWVYDDMAYPLYKERQCRFMSDQSACEKFGRSDLVYQKWTWQPDGCNLPRYVCTMHKIFNFRDHEILLKNFIFLDILAWMCPKDENKNMIFFSFFTILCQWKMCFCQ